MGERSRDTDIIISTSACGRCRQRPGSRRPAQRLLRRRGGRRTLALGVEDEDGSDSTDDDGSDGDQSSPSATVDPDEQAVLDAYQGYWDVYTAAVSEEHIDTYVEAINEDRVGDTPLANISSLDAQAEVLQTVYKLDTHGKVMTGAPERLDPRVTSLDMTADVPTAEVTDCLDVRNWKIVDRKTGEEAQVPEDQPRRYTAVAELEKWRGQWFVVDAAPDTDMPCSV